MFAFDSLTILDDHPFIAHFLNVHLFVLHQDDHLSIAITIPVMMTYRHDIWPASCDYFNVISPKWSIDAFFIKLFSIVCTFYSMQHLGLQWSVYSIGL